MSVVKFEATVEDGNIVVPTKFRNKVKGRVEVSVRVENKSEHEEEPYDIISELIRNPIKDPDFVPLKRDEIYDRKL